MNRAGFVSALDFINIKFNFANIAKLIKK